MFFLKEPSKSRSHLNHFNSNIKHVPISPVYRTERFIIGTYCTVITHTLIQSQNKQHPTNARFVLSKHHPTNARFVLSKTHPTNARFVLSKPTPNECKVCSVKNNTQRMQGLSCQKHTQRMQGLFC